jgi:DNA-binding NarL/FixJ family response regulator
MDTQEVFSLIDNLVFDHTGKHLDTLQLGILKNVFDGQKNAKIAEKYNCSEGHARDKAYELWRILSEVLGEELNKSTVRSAIERFITTSSTNNIVNSVKIDQVTFCHNPSNNREIENYNIYKTENNVIKAKLETVPKLIGLGLTIEQIAQALDLDIQLILDSLKPE